MPYVKVEDTLFKLPKTYFRTSSVFATIFTLPPGSEQDVEGTDAKPFVLHGINLVDFESLLKVMYPLSLYVNAPFGNIYPTEKRGHYK